mmetsp:Transcript_38120/g.65123  ORF Transcript_38120/g.65123 Transcript_38120/m.65123 type:complete len:496 (+) Transcript_38120:2-1489(+)
MEQMAAPLSEIIPLLLDSHTGTKKTKGATKIPMSDVAIAMLHCLQSIHDGGNIFVDVKPENFMLASALSSKTNKKGSPSKNSLGQRVRLIDFGLVEMYNDMTTCKHRENAHPNAPLVGTPAYASLNVMSGHTASRRDDLEALGYVISELILTLASTSASGSGKRTKTSMENVLPWSRAVSDEELCQMKLQEMDKKKRSKSKFFAGLKAAGADTVMGQYFEAVRGLNYAEKPDYESLQNYLKKLVVTVESAGVSAGVKKTSSASPKKAAKSPVRRRSARRKHEDSDADSVEEVVDENVENSKKLPGKKQKVSVGREHAARRTRSARNAPKTRSMGTQTDDMMDVIDLASSDEEEDADDTMEWEATVSDDENIEPTNNDVEGTAILKLDVIEGPHRGQEICFGGDQPDTVLIGRDPSSRAMKDASKFALSEDDTASAAHAKFVINSKKNVHSVRVSDMSSSNGTFINGSSLAKGKSRQAFVGDKIRIGDSILQIRKV